MSPNPTTRRCFGARKSAFFWQQYVPLGMRINQGSLETRDRYLRLAQIWKRLPLVSELFWLIRLKQVPLCTCMCIRVPSEISHLQYVILATALSRMHLSCFGWNTEIKNEPEIPGPQLADGIPTADSTNADAAARTNEYMYLYKAPRFTLPLFCCFFFGVRFSEWLLIPPAHPCRPSKNRVLPIFWSWRPGRAGGPKISSSHGFQRASKNLSEVRDFEKS